MVKHSIYKNKYKSLRLDSVCRAIIREGKYENLDGLKVQTLPKEKQLEYVAQDARLVMKLSKHNDFKILNIMNAISRVTRVQFDKVCHTGGWKLAEAAKTKIMNISTPNLNFDD